MTEDGGAFRIVNEFAGRDLAVGAGDALTTVAEGAGGAAGLFSFEQASGCADYPEIDVNVTGAAAGTARPTPRSRAFVETHMHQMAFEFLGSKAHCGRPWHRFGAPYALADCPDHAATDGCGAVLETVLSGEHLPRPGRLADLHGLAAPRAAHPRAVLLQVARALLARRACASSSTCWSRTGSSASSTRSSPQPQLQRDAQRPAARRSGMRELERYIDAQSGGPGKGWYRIVDDPVEARHVINDGKLAVVMGMEVSEPFGCRLMQPGNAPLCTEQQVDDGLDELYDLGVRQLELINKFDNALSGVAGDSGSTGTITNGGNFLSAGSFWDLEHCDDAGQPRPFAARAWSTTTTS